MESDVAERLNRLETHLAHLERQVEQMNEVVIGQGKELGRLLARLQGVGQTLQTIELERIKGTNPKPPHYE